MYRLRLYGVKKTVRVRSHRHKCESKYPCTSSKKHRLTRITMATVHIVTSFVRVRAVYLGVVSVQMWAEAVA